ncbi:MAG: peptide ABC transporter substrate-binding protein [Dehalococcoidia bacterium]|nr:peptide ABC transporter substrate-binding protein [Dehalococcoidia bacterium]
MPRRRFWPLPLFIFAGLVVVLAVGALVYAFGTVERPRLGGTYVEGIAGSPMSLNPLFSSFNDPDRDISRLLFSGLTTLGPDGTVTPDAADQWEVSPDGKTYTFHLRRGVRWHDGRPVSPEDVIFTCRLLQNKESQVDPDLTALWQRIKVEKADGESVRFILDQPYAPFLTYTTTGILPQHLLQDVAAKDIAKSGFNARPVGSGPFKIREVTVDQVTLDANPDYHAGRPYLNSITFKFFRDDQALASAIAANQVNGGLLRSTVGKDAIALVGQNREMGLRAMPRTSYSVLFLNTQSALFKSKAVRQALAYGINQEELVERVAGGLGVVAESPVPQDSWAYNANAKRYPYDPARAAQLLDAEGWKLNPNGIREKDGQQFKFALLTNDDKLRVATGEELVKTLRRIGVQAELAASGPTGLAQNFLIPRKYDAILYGIDPGSDPDPYPLWHSSQATADGLNVSGFSNQQADGLLEKARTTNDVPERKKLYDQFQDAFVEEMPSILLYHPVYTYAQDRRMRNVRLGVLYDTSSRFLNVREWYLETQRVWNPGRN